jgi:hypothetical protein
MPIKNHKRRAGQTLIIFTLALIPLMGILGLVVDIGWAYFRKEVAQTAADAAANAAAMAAYTAASGKAPLCSMPGVGCYAAEYSCPAVLISPPSDNIQAGCMYARDNGFVTAGRQQVTFQSGVGNPPTSSGVTVGYWVVVRVREQVPQLFSASLGFPTATVMARTTTGDRVGDAGGCVIALNPNASGAISMTGSTSLQSGCGVFVDSTSSSAITLSGGAYITTIGSAKTEIVGNCSGCASISPAPQTGVPAMSDPFAFMAAPTVGPCTDGGAGVNLGSHDVLTIRPGVFCGGISLTGQSSLTLEPGLYIMKNGLSMTGQTVINGAGVTIYMDSGGVSMTGGATVRLSAPSSGVWQGIQFFQNRSNTTAANLTGGAAQLMNGLLYFPAAHLTFTGGNSLNATATSLVGDTISMVGNSYIQSAAITHFTGNVGGVVMIE